MSVASAVQGWLMRFGEVLAGSNRNPWGDSLERVPLALVLLDEDGCMCRFNQGWQELSGYYPRESLGQEHARFVHIEDQSLWLSGLQALRQGNAEQPFVSRLRYLTRSGELRWVEVRVRRYRQGFIASLGDVSEQMFNRDSLLARHRSLSNLLDGIPVMVYRGRNNRNWSMEYVSAGCLALTGYDVGQLVNSQTLSYGALIHPDDRERIWCSVQEALARHATFAFDYRLLHADGGERLVSERGVGIYSDTEEVLGLEGVVFQRPG